MMLPAPKPLRDAETDSVWVIVPFSRPENLNLVLSNFNRQKFPFKKLVLVENGAAIGAAHSFTHMNNALVLMSERHQSIAKNTALHEIRKRGGGFTVVMDDDDWYGPHFLTEACGYARTYDIIGKNRHFVSVDGESMWLCHREQANRKTDWLTGGTIACWAENCPEYPMLRSGEDARFCLTAAKLGMSIYGTDVYHYLYRRSSTATHAWRINRRQLRDYESSARALDLGPENLDVVSGVNLSVDALPLYPEEAPTLLPPPPGVPHVST